MPLEAGQGLCHHFQRKDQVGDRWAVMYGRLYSGSVVGGCRNFGSLHMSQTQSLLQLQMHGDERLCDAFSKAYGGSVVQTSEHIEPLCSMP